MSGAGLPYRLRPHKAVDRRLFLEVLNRCQRWINIGSHAYISMGAYGLEDHKLIHRLLGISRLLTFDMDSEIVARQIYNRLTEDCKCRVLKSGDLVADVDRELDAAGIEDADGYIVWLDYTAPKEIFTQIGEFQKLISQYRSGDIVRVTINAEFKYWGGAEVISGRSVPLAERQKTAFQRLQRSLGEYFPNDLKAVELDANGVKLAGVLAGTFGQAAGKIIASSSGNVLEPISITRYSDGQQMLSLTAILVANNKRGEMREKMALNGWYFSSTKWSDVKFLVVPDLTIRERLYLERNVNAASSQIQKDVGFNFDSVTEMPGFLKNFREYYRHYPALTPVEV